MPLSWDDDDEEELTEIEYRKPKKSRVVVHEEITNPMAESYHRPLPKTPPEPEFPKASSPEPLQTPLVGPQPNATPSGGRTAPMRDRFAAGFLDTFFGFILYLLTGWGLAKFFQAGDLALLHANATRMALHFGVALLALFFYYLFMEAVFGATLGKLFCRLRVVDLRGAPPNLGSVFMRNILRVVDYPIFFLIAVISMESSPLNQRLGDRAAGTLVVKKSRPYHPVVNLQSTALASSLSRIFAEIFDLILVTTLVYAWLFFIQPGRGLQAAWFVGTAPLWYLAYYTLPEWISGTTPGKALFKRQVVLDHGEGPDGTAALIRNLLRPMDYLLGYPLMILTRKKQRLGDLVSDTVVVSRSAGAKGLWVSLITLAVVGLMAYIGLNQSNSALGKQYGKNPFKTLQVFTKGIPSINLRSTPTTSAKTPAKARTQLPQSTTDKLKVTEFYFATGPEPTQIRHDRKFRPGDLIFMFFKMEGVTTDEEQKVSLSENLKVENPDGKIVLNKPKIVVISKKLESSDQGVLFANNLQLPKDSPKGTYRVLVTVFDQNAGTQYSFERKFLLQ